VAGVSVENRRWLSRLDILSQIPAVVHFASFEPLLRDLGDIAPWLSLLNWAIIGGESGPHRRPMDIAWLTRLVTSARRQRSLSGSSKIAPIKRGSKDGSLMLYGRSKQLPLVFS